MLQNDFHESLMKLFTDAKDRFFANKYFCNEFGISNEFQATIPIKINKNHRTNNSKLFGGFLDYSPTTEQQNNRTTLTPPS